MLAICIACHRNDADVEVGCGPAVEAEFSLACVPALGGTGEVKKWKPDGTFELVGELSGEKDNRAVSVYALHVTFAMACGIRKKIHDRALIFRDFFRFHADSLELIRIGCGIGNAAGHCEQRRLPLRCGFDNEG